MALSLQTFTNTPSSLNTTYSFSVGSFNGGDTRDSLNLSLTIRYNNRWCYCYVDFYANSTTLCSNTDVAADSIHSYNLSSNTSLTLKYKIRSVTDGNNNISLGSTMDVIASLGNNSLVSKNLGSISLGNKNLNIGYYSYGYYSFIPDKSGSYTLVSPSNISGCISTSISSTNTTSGNTVSMDLTAGTTYYISFRNTRESNYDAVTGTATLTYNPPITYINYVYNGSNTRKQKEGNSYSLDSISSLGYTLDGWTFAGWNTEAENNNIVYQDSGTFSIQEDITEYYLYPIWRKNFSITYRYGYPDIVIEQDIASIYSYERYTNNYEPLETATYSEVRVLYTTKSVIPSFEYDTRTFSAGAWYVGNTTQYVVLGKEINISSDTIFNCGYSSNNLSLFYDGNDEKVQGSTSNVTTIPQVYSVASQTFQVRGVAAAECGFTLSGKKFKEWNTSSDGSGISYKAGDIVKLSINTTLYAIWINADEPFIYLSNKQVKPYLFRNNKYYEIKFM